MDVYTGILLIGVTLSAYKTVLVARKHKQQVQDFSDMADGFQELSVKFAEKTK